MKELLEVILTNAEEKQLKYIKDYYQKTMKEKYPLVKYKYSTVIGYCITETYKRILDNNT